MRHPAAGEISLLPEGGNGESSKKTKDVNLRPINFSILVDMIKNMCPRLPDLAPCLLLVAGGEFTVFTQPRANL